MTGERQAAIARSLRLSAPLADAVADLVAQLGLPSRLRNTGLAHEALPEIATAGFDEAVAVSPRPLDGPEALRSLLDEMW